MKETALCKQFNVYIFEFSQLCCFCERRMLSDISMNSGHGYCGKTVKNASILL